MEVQQRSSEARMSGPDQVLDTSSYVTSNIDSAVKLRLDDSTEQLLPMSLPTMLMNAAEKSPNQVALGVKRDGEWKKWTYIDYLKGEKYYLCCKNGAHNKSFKILLALTYIEIYLFHFCRSSLC